MTTKPPSPVEPFPSESRESIAYESVADVRTLEPNDRNRLGYHVWRWLTTGEGTLEEAVRESGARLEMPVAEAVRSVRERLAARGIGAA